MKMYIPPPGEKPSRRSVLKKGLIGGAVLALGGGWLFTRRSADVSLPTAPLQVLSAREYAVVYVLVQRFHPSRKGFPDAQALDVAKVCDGILAKADATAQKELKQLLMLFENALPAFLFGFRTLPFTRLAPQEQDVVLAEWASSRIAIRRTGYLALRTLVMAGYWSQKPAWPASGYAGPPPVNDPNAPVWKGGGEPRPMGNGVWVEPVPVEAPAPDAPAPEGTP
jgi:hypothetical protein